ncbi:ABC transporter permease subunit [Bacillus sp. SS-TM]
MNVNNAANDLGATPWQTFRYVTFPAIAPGVISAALLTTTNEILNVICAIIIVVCPSSIPN